ncbi:MAG TPA: sodium:proton antiporter, partial [Syntrophales bacterium]|nr:sodium:proton antiporter [Syntrophales bacterium]
MEKSQKRLLNILIYAPVCLLPHLVFATLAAAAETAGPDIFDIGTKLPVWTALPFAGILLSIALCPLLLPYFWHNHFGKISAFWALLFAVPFLLFYRDVALYHILHIYLIDYIPFIILLWGLFTIAGGIVIRGSLRGTPALNTIMLAIGTVLASCVGTTGAAMVMIRPVLRANKERMKRTHVVCFFIFLVANIGGSLTPLGDPPLFLGFLHNVPFFWVTMGLLPHMLTASVLLLALFFIVDTLYYGREKRQIKTESVEEKIPLKVEGSINFVFLAGVIIFVFMSGYWKAGHFSAVGIHLEYQNMVRDLGIITMGILSLVFTTKRLREANDFSWFPIMEVTKLFAGIFMTIIPALAILKAGSGGAMSGLVTVIRESYHYFWVTGTLSSFLDNAPTYLTFFNLALGNLGITEAMVPGALTAKAATAHPEFIMYLKAISAGAVFMGANTYIG